MRQMRREIVYLDTLDFSDGGSHHGEKGEEDADSDPLEHRDAPHISSEVARDRHKHAVVNRDEAHDCDGDEALQRGCRDLEVLAQIHVQRVALASVERGDLRGERCKEERRDPNG